MKYSQRVNRLLDSPTLAIAAKAKKMIASGQDVVSFSAGEPDFNTPDFVKHAGIEAIENNYTGYTSALGIPELRKIVAGWMSNESMTEYKQENILISHGAKYAIALALLATMDSDDEVIIPAPYWVSYPQMVSLSSAKPVIMDCPISSGYKITPDLLEKTITPSTRMIFINNPSNPTGTVYTKQELVDIANVLEKYPDIWILSDEIYSRIVYDDAEFISIAALSENIKERTIIANGVSKAFSMTGWRLGWMAANKELIKQAGKIQSHTISCPSSISQRAAVKALTGDDSYLENWVETYKKRRDLLLGLVGEIEGIEPFCPSGAFYLFCDISQWIGKTSQNGFKIDSCLDAAEFLLNEALVALVPGGAFGAPGHIRFSFACSEDNIVKGCARIKQAIEGLR